MENTSPLGGEVAAIAAGEVRDTRRDSTSAPRFARPTFRLRRCFISDGNYSSGPSCPFGARGRALDSGTAMPVCSFTRTRTLERS